MKLITRELLALEAAKRFNKVYGEGTRWENDIERRKIIESLLALGEKATPDAVNKIIGNDSWTWTFCHECNTSDVPVVELGQEPDYESATASICLDCLKKSVLMIEQNAYQEQNKA